MALHAGEAARAGTGNCDGTWVFGYEGDVPGPVCRGLQRGGFAVVVFDNRNFGASDGQPRQEIDPWQQIRDYSDAITFARTLEQTDRERIGIWGSSYSGGHVLIVAAIDRRDQHM